MSSLSSRPVALVLLRRAEHALFAALLVIGAVRAVLTGHHAVVAVGGAAAVAAWYLLGIVLARRRAPRAAALGWLLVLTAGCAALVVGSVDFVWLAFPLFLLYTQLLPLRAALPSVAVLTVGVIAALGVDRGVIDAAAVIGPIVGAAVAVVITVVYRDLRREAEARARLVDELTAAQERLAATQRRAGTLAERERVARDIHDTVTQSLSSIVLVLRSAREGYADAPPAARAQLQTALDAARAALEDTRRLIRALTPAELVGRSLPEALRRLVAHRADLDVQLVVDGDPYPLPTPVAVALLRAAQEGIANVSAHAGAGRVGLTLTFQPHAVSVDVVDDGKGFDPQRPGGPTTGTGMGLDVMRSRLAEVGGTLVVESAPGLGTALGATVSMPEEGT